ncbi:hypothetical protein M758_8G039400 [Ceratodon purpureus]|nr:hypothetical protein M758_8G039400 [Ceratodon purpureus]
MSLGVSEREHLAGVPVEDGAVGLGVGCDDGVNESTDVTRPIEQHQAIMEVNGFSQSDEAVAPIQCSKMSLPTSSPIAKSSDDGHVRSEEVAASEKGNASPLFKVHPSSEETNGLKYESEAVAIAEVSKTCSAAGALRVPVVDSQEVPALAECKLDASPEIKGARRQQIVGGTPVSVPASRVSSARKGKELQGQAGRVLRANADGVAGGNSSPRSLRASHRRVPLGWFPRGQKTESYLERKIRMLQQTEGGKIASLDETLGASNVHLSRIEREKQAASAAATAATKTRKVALVEASWCRILKATGIPYMSAALELQKAEKAAEEALAAAAALGVILGHSPRSPRYVTDSDCSSGGHDNISATLETAFHVDKAVAAALKTALLRHTSELKDAELQRAMALITNPLVNVSTGQREWVDGTSKAVLEGSDQNSNEASQDSENSMVTSPKCAVSADGSSQENPLVELMLQRVRGLQPEECTSMATIVATRGLGALLQEENLEQEVGAKSEVGGGLGDVLVKHVSRLEAEKAAAKTAGEGGRAEMKRRLTVVLNPVPDLGSMFVKHVSRLEREKKAAIEAAAKEAETWIPGEAAKFDDLGSEEGLDKIFVKKMSRLEKEKAAAQQRRRSSLNKFSPRKGRRVSLTRRPGLGECLIKHKSRLEKEIEAAKARRLSTSGKSMKKVAVPQPSPPKRVSLGGILIKHKSRLEREKEAAKLASQAASSTVPTVDTRSESPCVPMPNGDAQEAKCNSDVAENTVVQSSLADLGARKLSKLEMEKQAAAAASSTDPWARRRPSFKARNDSSEIWAGVGLGAALKRHVSKLEQEQAAWRNAEEMARAH